MKLVDLSQNTSAKQWQEMIQKKWRHF